MTPLTVYQYAKCSTCRKALRWLDEHDIAYEPVDIVTSPPTVGELRSVLELSALPIKKLFNVSGESYRNGGWKERITSVSEDDALSALAADGKLIKRPLVLVRNRRAGGLALVGFDEGAWTAALL